MAIASIDVISEDHKSFFHEIFEEATAGVGKLTYGGVVRTIRRVLPTERFRRFFDSVSIEKDSEAVQFFLSLARRICDWRLQADDFDAAIELCLMERAIQDSAPKEELPEDVKSLVQEMRKRTWCGRLSIVTRSGKMSTQGYVPDDHEADRRRLERLIEKHNALFAHRPGLEEKPGIVGCLERLDLVPPNGTQKGDTLYVRADVHSDFSVLLAQLEMHRRDGDMDEEFRCRPGFHVGFLGDYIDRGANDIEVLSVLLSLHMANPNSVHLLRGNHESFEMASLFSPEASWIEQHSQAFATLYQSFPLAICAGVPGKEAQYVHFSHGLFAVWMHLRSLRSSNYCSVPYEEPEYDVAPEEISPEKKHFLSRIDAVSGLDQTASGYLWSDVRAKSGRSERNSSCLDLSGCSLSPDDIYAYGQVACGNDGGTLEAFVRGHEHFAKEWIVRRKDGSENVLVTTLPAGSIGDIFGPNGGRQRAQGVFYTPSPLVREWKKRLAIMEGDGPNARLVAGEKTHEMFDRMFPGVVNKPL